MSAPNRSRTLGCMVALFALILFAVTATSGIASWLAYLRPEKDISWWPLAVLTAGFLIITFLISSVAWKKFRDSKPRRPVPEEGGQ